MKVFGLDFGTSTTMLAVREGDNHPRLIQLGSNSNWIPSLAGLDGKGGLVVGEPAEKLPLDRKSVV